MNIKKFRDYFNKTLKKLYPTSEIDTFLFLLLEEYLNFKRIDIVLKSNFEISPEDLILLRSSTKLLEQEIPIQYILGKTEFYGFPFILNEHVLIPRPETEELISSILENVLKTRSFHTNANEKQLKILDIGTGSGCIPISLKKSLPFAEITAIDVSNEALTIAKKNAVLNKVDINLTQQDILNTTSLNQLYDVIVSNPPYVRESEKKEIKNNVLNNEPHMALFVEDNNPLVFYNKIAELAKNHLTKNGTLFFEINQYLGKETVELIKLKGFNKIQLKKDIFGRDRIIIASL
ncbi:MAG: peptide chain release factor N(5)-glutamine methyltransferase [Flavobacteriaceae bacterium]|jgi:release factor glutamine methyltransferase|nr:peptide chain release factor N(5)-glutamine methyltransferase [Flavobacteriaceae bacterium]MDG1160460.1 peptide chain release factor N(5)-glutamine methyltransferase [Flavobacteriaceae bacterium]MDG1980291.1 peptide chain release factor N(5)-glutamine methyltransferase [Flavobacteriaceae bacterium]|tara:strand:- start:5938 stop:6810 length:873 start_codon:yes stop_codon:yes gene_type:complete